MLYKISTTKEILANLTAYNDKLENILRPHNEIKRTTIQLVNETSRGKQG